MRKIIDILEEIHLCVHRIETYNDIIDETNCCKIDGHGLSSNASSVLYAMTNAIEGDLKQITEKIEKIYEINKHTN